jgi:lipopolysaccharide/colanic/teichoic acid biosynthesis glycosyltransferase
LAFKDEGERLANAKDADSCYRDEILPEKLAIQARYAQERTLAGDIRLLFRTLGALRG